MTNAEAQTLTSWMDYDLYYDKDKNLIIEFPESICLSIKELEALVILLKQVKPGKNRL